MRLRAGPNCECLKECEYEKRYVMLPEREKEEEEKEEAETKEG